MNSFINLLKNEHMKIYKKLSTYIMMAILVLVIITVGVLVKISENRDLANNSRNLKDNYTVQIKNMQNQLNDEKLAKEEKAQIENEIFFLKYSLNNNIESDSYKNEIVMDMKSIKLSLDNQENKVMYDKLDVFVKNGDWRGYYESKQKNLNEIVKSAKNEKTVAIQKIQLETINLRLKYNISPEKKSNDFWKNSELKSNEQSKQNLLAIENKTVSSQTEAETLRTKKTLENQIKLSEYRIQNNIKPTTQEKTIWEFVNDIMGNFINVLLVFVVIVSSGIMASEFSDGTIKLMMIRPYKRWEILLSKYLTIFLYTIEMLFVLIATAFLVGGLMYGFHLPPNFLYISGSVVMEQSYFLRLLFEMLLSLAPLVMVFSLAFMISTVFKNSGLSIGISLMLMFLGSTIVFILATSLKFTWTKYILFANWNISTYFTEGSSPLVEGMTLSFSLIVLAVYFVIFNATTFFVFTKRDVAT